MLAKASFGELLLGIIDRPGRTLANIIAYPRWRWLFPALFAVAAIAVYTILATPFLIVQMQQVTAQVLSRMPAGQAAAAQQAQAQMAFMRSPAVVAGSTLAFGVLGLAVGWLIQAAVLYFGALVGGGDLPFGGVFAATPWLGIPFALESLLQAAYIRLNGHLIVNQGLSYLVSGGNSLQDARNLAYVALSQVTLFRLWHLVMVYALLRAAARFSRGAAFWLTVIYIVLLVGGQLALAALGRLVSPA